MNSIRLGVIGLIAVVTILLVSFILGLIDTETLKNSGVRAVAVIGVLVASFIAIAYVAQKDDK